MSWTLQRWTWLLEGPLFVGAAPASSLNRCRLYVPASAIWGAITAEAARNVAKDFPHYDDVGTALKNNARFSYLYPAERVGDRWIAWLPRHDKDLGLVWEREDGRGEPQADRRFRRRLLTTRPGTAIDPSSDSAAAGSLRETECVCDRWRDAEGEDDRVAFVGYVFTRNAAVQEHVKAVKRIFLGGDTRYGLGRMRREAFEQAQSQRVFGSITKLDTDAPQVMGNTTLAHARVDVEKSMTGALELLSGWKRGSLRSLKRAAPLWQPGSRSENHTRWSIEEYGLWSAME